MGALPGKEGEAQETKQTPLGPHHASLSRQSVDRTLSATASLEMLAGAQALPSKLCIICKHMLRLTQGMIRRESVNAILTDGGTCAILP